MSTDNNRKKSGGSSGPEVTTEQATQSAKRPNVFGLYGNQEVTNHTQRQATPQIEQTPALQAAESEQAGSEQLAGTEQVWWTENEQTQSQGVEEEETQILRAPAPEAAAQVDQRTTTPTFTPAPAIAPVIAAPVIVKQTVLAPTPTAETAPVAEKAPSAVETATVAPAAKAAPTPAVEAAPEIVRQVVPAAIEAVAPALAVPALAPEVVQAPAQVVVAPEVVEAPAIEEEATIAKPVEKEPTVAKAAAAEKSPSANVKAPAPLAAAAPALVSPAPVAAAAPARVSPAPEVVAKAPEPVVSTAPAAVKAAEPVVKAPVVAKAPEPAVAKAAPAKAPETTKAPQPSKVPAAAVAAVAGAAKAPEPAKAPVVAKAPEPAKAPVVAKAPEAAKIPAVAAKAPEAAKIPAVAAKIAPVVAPVVVPQIVQVVEVVKAPALPEEQSLMAKRAPQSEAASDKAKADRDAARGRRLSPQEEAQELQLKKAAMAAGLLAQDEKELIRAADAANYDEDEKAEMLIEQGGAIEESVLATQSGEVQALLAAENLPATVAELDRVAASDAKQSPLGENDTIRNVTDMMQLISQRIDKYPDLASPNLSIEDKATKLVELMAEELDVPTLESISSHAYVGLVEDLVFDPKCMLEINRLSGGDRNVRVMGSFAAVLWQHAVDALQNRLLSMPDDTRIHETEMFGSVLRNLSMKMYTDALIKPPGNVA